MHAMIQNATKKNSSTNTALEIRAKIPSWPVCLAISGAIHGEEPLMACKAFIEALNKQASKQTNEQTNKQTNRPTDRPRRTKKKKFHVDF